jgi:hypothetical protein
MISKIMLMPETARVKAVKLYLICPPFQESEMGEVIKRVT